MRRRMGQLEKNRLRLWLRGEQALGLNQVSAKLLAVDREEKSGAFSTGKSPSGIPPTGIPSRPPFKSSAEVSQSKASSGFSSPDRNPQPVSVVPQNGSSPAMPRQVRTTPASVSKPPANVSDAPKVSGTATSKPTASSPALISLPNEAAFDSPILNRDQRVAKLKILDEQHVKICTKCCLHETRTNTVFGEGNPMADIFFIGEGPGETEDNTGRPFVGRAGQLLDKMIVSMGITRQDVFIANIVKCRPPGNRVPGPDEVSACTPYLLQQLEILRPKVIVTLGRPATIYMLNSKLAMGALRGKWHSWRGIKLMPTFHPSYVLRVYTEDVRKTVWNDLKLVMAEIAPMK